MCVGVMCVMRLPAGVLAATAQVAICGLRVMQTAPPPYVPLALAPCVLIAFSSSAVAANDRGVTAADVVAVSLTAIVPVLCRCWPAPSSLFPSLFLCAAPSC